MENLRDQQANTSSEIIPRKARPIIQTQSAILHCQGVGDSPRQFIRHFEERGSVKDLSRSDGPRSVRNGGLHEIISENVEDGPNISTRRRSGQGDIFRTSCRGIL